MNSNEEMGLFQAIEVRYSHKEAFLPDPVPMDHLRQIALAGITAPSGANRQTVRLIILPERADVAPLYGMVDHVGLGSAPAAIALFTDGNTQTDTNNFEVEDYSAACENILLAAAALGYSSLWLDYPFLSNADVRHRAQALMNAPDGFTLRVVIPIGRPDGPGSRREKMSYGERVFCRSFR